MKLKDIMLKDVLKATKEEIEYVMSSTSKQYVYSKNGEIIYVFTVLQNGDDIAIGKYMYKEDREVISSFEEITAIKNTGEYDIEENV